VQRLGGDARGRSGTACIAGRRGVGPSSSGVSSCGAVSAVLPVIPEISSRTPILATHPQGRIRPLVGPHPSGGGGGGGMQLGGGDPPHGVGWGVGPSSSGGGVLVCWRIAVSEENK
jgi:hypothetical protein